MMTQSEIFASTRQARMYDGKALIWKEQTQGQGQGRRI